MLVKANWAPGRSVRLITSHIGQRTKTHIDVSAWKGNSFGTAPASAEAATRPHQPLGSGAAKRRSISTKFAGQRTSEATVD